MKKIILSFILMIITNGVTFAADSNDVATELLRTSDRGRGGIAEGVQWNATIDTVENNESSSRQFFIRAKDHDAYVEATAPAKNKSEVYLFNDRQMWFFKPSLKKPVSISPRQKLTGQAANGDIASTHYARDYSATLEKTEEIDGEKFHVLFLQAKTKNLTYDKIRYWVSDKTKLASKIEFLTLAGKPFKIGKLEYQNKITLNKKVFPFVSKLTINDAKYPKNVSVIKYENPTVQEHSASLFNINNLTR